MQSRWLRVPRTRKSAVHWLDEYGEVVCRTALDADQIAAGRAVSDRNAATCGACCKLIEDRERADYFGRKKAAPPPPDFGPLFKPRKAW